MHISQAFAHRALVLQKHAPNLLFVAGIGCVVGGTVLACRATLKLEGTLEDIQDELHVANNVDDDENGNEVTRGRNVSFTYVRGGVKIIRLYGPALVVGTAGIAALTRSHVLLTRRNAALTAAYAALESGFNAYRQRVIEKYGEEEDRNFRYNIQNVEVIDPETKKTKVVALAGPDEASIYARFFDQLSPNWSKEPEYNLLFLKAQQNYANDLLKSRGHVFLNEAYDMLGLPRSRAGAVIGWILSRQGDTDNYINFGIFDDHDSARDFVNGREGSILLDFNVDGVIFDKITDPGEELSWQKGS